MLESFHFQSLVEQRQVDDVRHGHPLLLTVGTLSAALGEWGFEVVDAQPVPVYSGSMLVVAARAEERPFRHPPSYRHLRQSVPRGFLIPRG